MARSLRSHYLAQGLLIGEFRAELKGKDEEYVKSLKQQGEDITQLTRACEQYQDLQREYASELGQIEEAFMRERRSCFGNKSEIDALLRPAPPNGDSVHGNEAGARGGVRRGNRRPARQGCRGLLQAQNR